MQIPAPKIHAVLDLRAGRVVGVHSFTLAPGEKPILELFIITAELAVHLQRFLDSRQTEEAYDFLERYGNPISLDLEFERVRR